MTNAKSVTLLKQLFDADTHKVIEQYVRDQVPMMSIGSDPTDFVRTFVHNPALFVHIHGQLTEIVSEMCGQPLKPSYSYLSMYRDGGRCPLHIDRMQCYMTLDYLIQHDTADLWPLMVSEPMTDSQRDAYAPIGHGFANDDDGLEERMKAETWTEVLLEPNDAVLYSGTHQWHYRTGVLTGSADLVFFHFVPADFQGPLD